MILISLIKVNLIKEGTVEKNKSKKRQASKGHPARHRERALWPGSRAAAGHGGKKRVELLHLFGPWAGAEPPATLAARPDLLAALQQNQHLQGGI